MTKGSSISIFHGHYNDSIWCNVIPMTIIYLFLGWPWLYDQAVFYHGRVNTFFHIQLRGHCLWSLWVWNKWSNIPKRSPRMLLKPKRSLCLFLPWRSLKERVCGLRWKVLETWSKSGGRNTNPRAVQVLCFLRRCKPWRRTLRFGIDKCLGML